MRANAQPYTGTPLNLSHPLCKGLKLYYPMNENGGMRLFNYAGVNQGTINGTAGGWSQGIKGRGFNCNATDNFISSLYPSTALMTISFWLRMPTAPGATNNTGIFFWDGATMANFISCEISGSTPNIFINKANVANFRGNSSAAILKDGNWHHVVFAVDKSAAASSNIYIDGVEISYTATANQTFNADTGFAVSRFLVGATSRFGIGLYNSLMIWDRKLSYTEVRQLYTNSYQMFQQRKIAI